MAWNKSMNKEKGSRPLGDYILLVETGNTH